MEKSKLDGFIGRYSLGGEIESVIIKSDDSTISVRMISDDKTLLGSVTVNDTEFPIGEFGIYTTSQLKGFLSVLNENLSVEEVTGALKISDKKTTVQYMLASPSVIPQVPDLKMLPDFGVEITLDDDFINTFVKSKGVLSDSDVFTFMYKDGKGKVVLGYSTINSNRISIDVDCTSSTDVEPIGFSAKYLKGILVANKGSTDSKLRISSDGLAHLSFTHGEYTSEYFLVEVK